MGLRGIRTVKFKCGVTVYEETGFGESGVTELRCHGSARFEPQTQRKRLAVSQKPPSSFLRTVQRALAGQNVGPQNPTQGKWLVHSEAQ